MPQFFFLNKIYSDHLLPDNELSTEVIWSDGPSSEFKNQYMNMIIKELSNKHQKPFIWKFSATSHGKGVVDGVGGKIKSSVHKKVMSLGKDRPIVQDSESFARLAKELSQSTTIVHVSNEEVNAYKELDPFSNSIPVHGISKMHVMKSNGKTSYFWTNSSYHKSGSQPNIQIPPPQNQASEKSNSHGDANSNISNKIISTGKNPLSYHDVVKVVKGNYLGYYAIITELGDLSNLDDDDEVEINYLKKSFGKWVIIEKDLDSRMICELKHVNAVIDGRSHYSITE